MVFYVSFLILFFFHTRIIHTLIRFIYMSFPFSHLRPSQKVVSSHLLGNGQSHGSEDCGCHITENTTLLLEAPALGGVCHDERNLVRGVRGLGLSIGELHLLSVAVVGSDEEDVSLLLATLQNHTNSLVGSLTTNNGGLVHTGVANHVWRSKVVHDERELLLSEALDNLLGNSGSAHFGSLVVRRNTLVGGDEILRLVTGFEREYLLDTTVEEEGDVSVLLGFRNVDLLNVLCTEPLSEHVAHVLRLEGNLEGEVELILGHRNQGDLRKGEVGQGRPVDITQQLSDLTDTIGAVVEEEDNIVICELVSILDVRGRRGGETNP